MKITLMIFINSCAGMAPPGHTLANQNLKDKRKILSVGAKMWVHLMPLKPSNLLYITVI